MNWLGLCGLRAQATDQHMEEPPPLYKRESRSNPANVDVDRTGVLGSDVLG